MVDKYFFTAPHATVIKIGRLPLIWFPESHTSDTSVIRRSRGDPVNAQSALDSDDGYQARARSSRTLRI